MAAKNANTFDLRRHLTGEKYLDDKLQEWFDWDQNDDTRKEMETLLVAKKHDELRQLLLTRLTFGTAGIRGFMRTGYAAMNDLVIIQTSQGLADYVSKIFPDAGERGVIIGYDARYNSKRFAQRTAVAFLNKNIPVYLYSDIVPTPFIPFGIRQYKCVAGVMVTASHNPKGDNGYKVYFANGAQIISPHDKAIQSSIEENLKPWENAWDRQILSRTKDPLQAVKDEYYKDIQTRIFDAEAVKTSDLSFVYTSLHGVGHKYLTDILGLCGFPKFHAVAEQQEPDPDFPTVNFPNPEEGKGVLDLSMKTGDATGSTVILANDPDADRCAVAEKQEDGSWRLFNGNEVGALLGWWAWFLQRQLRPNERAEDCYMIASAVSSKVLGSLASKEGFNFIETLTGFKWMGNRSDQLVKEGKRVLFAFEEAIGYMCGSHVLDKDGISAAVEVAQLACYVRAKMGTPRLADHLTYIYNTYGYHSSLNSYYLCHDQETIKRIFSRLSNFSGKDTYPETIGPYKIKRVRDLNRAYDSATVGNVPELPSSSSSYMLTFYFENGVVLTIRTSGTEPKIKYYTEAITPPDQKNWDDVDKMLIDLVWNMINLCLEPEKNGLKPKSD